MRAILPYESAVSDMAAAAMMYAVGDVPLLAPAMTPKVSITMAGDMYATPKSTIDDSDSLAVRPDAGALMRTPPHRWRPTASSGMMRCGRRRAAVPEWNPRPRTA